MYCCEQRQKKGEILEKSDLDYKRPGFGLHPRYLSDICGKAAKKDIKKGTPLKWDLI
jgi:pseudaminic acid synthase